MIAEYDVICSIIMRCSRTWNMISWCSFPLSHDHICTGRNWNSFYWILFFLLTLMVIRLGRIVHTCPYFQCNISNEAVDCFNHPFKFVTMFNHLINSNQFPCETAFSPIITFLEINPSFNQFSSETAILIHVKMIWLRTSLVSTFLRWARGERVQRVIVRVLQSILDIALPWKNNTKN